MNEEYMPAYRPVDMKGLASKLAGATWSLIALAALTFFWAVYMFVTAPTGGAGGLLPTPVEGRDGLATALAWWAVVAGFCASIGSLAPRAPRALGLVEPVLGIVPAAGGALGYLVHAPSGHVCRDAHHRRRVSGRLSRSGGDRAVSARRAEVVYRARGGRGGARHRACRRHELRCGARTGGHLRPRVLCGGAGALCTARSSCRASRLLPRGTSPRRFSPSASVS